MRTARGNAAALRLVPRRDISADVRRTEILAATLKVIARDGLSAVTMEKVAAVAAISPGTITFHFQRKEQLLLALLDHVAGEFEAARREAMAGAEGDPQRALSALIEVTFDKRFSAPEKVAVWYAFWGEANARATYMARVGSHDRAYHDGLVALIGRLIADGGYRHLDAEAVAYGFAGVLEALWQEILVDGRGFDRRRAVRIARAYLTGIFQRHFHAVPIP
jgi:TetR/AcrR family transcriptional repressor of bet genes